MHAQLLSINTLEELCMKDFSSDIDYLGAAWCAHLPPRPEQLRSYQCVQSIAWLSNDRGLPTETTVDHSLVSISKISQTFRSTSIDRVRYGLTPSHA